MFEPPTWNALLTCWNLIAIGIGIGLGSMLVKNGKALQDLELTAQDLGYVNQLVDDWTVQPFTQIQMTDDYYCPDGWTEVYERVWYGLTIACDCEGVKKAKCSGDKNSEVVCGDFNYDMECPDAYTKDRVGCSNIGAQPAIR